MNRSDLASLISSRETDITSIDGVVGFGITSARCASWGLDILTPDPPPDRDAETLLVAIEGDVISADLQRLVEDVESQTDRPPVVVGHMPRFDPDLWNKVDRVLAPTGNRAGYFEPVSGGIAIGPSVVGPGYLTLGAAAIRHSRPGTPVGVVTCAHGLTSSSGVVVSSVLAVLQSAAEFRQSAPCADETLAVIGVTQLHGIPTFVDCAVSTIVPHRSGALGVIDGVGASCRSIVPYSQVAPNMPVQKSAATTGLTRGAVHAVHFNWTNSNLVNQIIAISDGPFQEGGDSGSLLLRNQPDQPPAIIGVAHSRVAGHDMAVVSPIEAVCACLEITF